jgi:hypothetical protein
MGISCGVMMRGAKMFGRGGPGQCVKTNTPWNLDGTVYLCHGFLRDEEYVYVSGTIGSHVFPIVLGLRVK